VSRQGAREDERLRSPDFQRDLMRGVLGGDYELVPFEAEIDVSGSKPKRAILDEIIEAIEAGELDGIAVAKLDRLSRLSPKDRIELFDRIESAGGIVRSASEKIDESTPEGRLSREIFLGIARYQWEKYAEGFETAKIAAIEAGRAIKSTAPFGYRFDEEHRLEVVEAEAAVVVELFERRAEGASFGELADVFGELTGRERPAMSIRRMLENRVYLGELRYAELVNEQGAPAIVELDVFEAVQAVNAERARARCSPGSPGARGAAVRWRGSGRRAAIATSATLRGRSGALRRRRSPPTSSTPTSSSASSRSSGRRPTSSSRSRSSSARASTARSPSSI
jgi:DNA invertase Pin-like site-specific DNA recombinase